MKTIKKNYCWSFLILTLISTGSSLAMAEDIESGELKGSSINQKLSSLFTRWGANFSVGYNTNLYTDHREDRSLSWNLGLNTSFMEVYQLYLSTGGYRSFDTNRGDFNTDTLLGAISPSLYQFGETGKVKIKGQLTLPTSEYSQDTKLITALRLELPVSFKYQDIGLGLSPKIKKNFHQYETIGDSSLTEWTYSLSVWANYAWSDFAVGISSLGGKTVSYQGTVRDTLNYSGSIYIAYSWTDHLSTTFSAANAGYYADTERGSLGDIDFFNAADSSVNFDVTYSF